MSEPSEPPEGPAGEEPSPQPPEAEAAEQAEQAEAAGESGTADFEGPRRRARREREERRTLAEKARALELARLEAKRKAHAMPQRKVGHVEFDQRWLVDQNLRNGHGYRASTEASRMRLTSLWM